MKYLNIPELAEIEQLSHDGTLPIAYDDVISIQALLKQPSYVFYKTLDFYTKET